MNTYLVHTTKSIIIYIQSFMLLLGSVGNESSTGHFSSRVLWNANLKKKNTESILNFFPIQPLVVLVGIGITINLSNNYINQENPIIQLQSLACSRLTST